MNIKIRTAQLNKVKADAVITGIFAKEKKLTGELAALDNSLNGAISGLIKKGELKGKASEITVIHSLGKISASKVLVVGLGKKKELTKDDIRGTVAEATRLLKRKSAKKVAVGLLRTDETGISLLDAAQMITEGALLGNYSFLQHKTKKDANGNIDDLVILSDKKKSIAPLEDGQRRGEVIAKATNLARDMGNEPANFMTPTIMAETAQKVAKENNLEFTLLEKEQMAELGMGGLLAVSQGSCQPPKFIILNYKGGNTDKIDLALVGKGVTFDSGGISIKPSHKMEEMKGDMAGGASVLAAMGAIASLKPKINIMALVPATENLPSGCALKPGDVITGINGKTVEIISTDAEGRLILADALGYAVKMGARRIVDIATLTGSCQVALGNICTGVFANNQRLAEKVLAAGKEAGERSWQMPMFDDYKEQNKSDVADIQNVGGRYAGSITAAQFLGEFVGNVPWVHMDIAGTSSADVNKQQFPKGATGVPVGTLVNLALSMGN